MREDAVEGEQKEKDAKIEPTSPPPRSQERAHRHHLAPRMREKTATFTHDRSRQGRLCLEINPRLKYSKIGTVNKGTVYYCVHEKRRAVQSAYRPRRPTVVMVEQE